MRWIQKAQHAPPALTACQRLPPAQGGTYAALDKRPVIRALLEDQGYLCGFCMRRVEPFERGANGTLAWRKTASHQWPWKIAHLQPQSVHGPRALDWTNMVGACRGGDDPAGGHGPPRTCDTLQGSSSLKLDPHNRATVQQVLGRRAQRPAVPAPGDVQSDGYELHSEDPVIHDDLRLRLGLNEAYLPDNRQAALDAFRLVLREKLPRHTQLSAHEKDARVRALYDEWKWEDRARTRLRPFCGVVEVAYRL